jgi:hypothetical protein
VKNGVSEKQIRNAVLMKLRATQLKRKSKRKRIYIESVEIDERIKKLLAQGIQKAGSRKKLAQILGYSVPTNIIYQFMHAQTYRRKIPVEKLNRLQQFLE